MISLAYANSAAAPGGLMSFVPFIVIFILFYFMLIRPQMKQAKDHKKLISELIFLVFGGQDLEQSRGGLGNF